MSLEHELQSKEVEEVIEEGTKSVTQTTSLSEGNSDVQISIRTNTTADNSTSTSLSECVGTTNTDKTTTSIGEIKQHAGPDASDDPCIKAQEAAAESLRSQFGDMDAQAVAGVVLRMTPKACARHKYSTYSCCEASPHVFLNELRWTCFVALYPKAASRIDAIARWRKNFLKSLGGNTSGDDYATLTRTVEWDLLITDGFDMSSTDPRWEPRRDRLGEELKELEAFWANTEHDLDQIDPVFDEYLKKIKSSVKNTIQSISAIIFKLDWRGDTLQEALQRKYKFKYSRNA
jgi:uncharacterized protein YnzC (UPF0291/DUF896 family)